MVAEINTKLSPLPYPDKGRYQVRYLAETVEPSKLNTGNPDKILSKKPLPATGRDDLMRERAETNETACEDRSRRIVGIAGAVGEAPQRETCLDYVNGMRRRSVFIVNIERPTPF